MNSSPEHTVRTIIMVDIVGSVALKMRRGEADAATLIADRLSAIEAIFRAVDPTITRSGPSEGDSLVLLGENTLALFQAAVLLQGAWKTWAWSRGVPATRIAIGSGEFTSMADGQFVSQRGIAVDLTHRVLDLCPTAGVAVTESVRSIEQAAGLAYKLIRLEAEMKGFLEPQSYYIADGIWEPGLEAKAENYGAASVPVAVIQQSNEPAAGILGAHFWNGRFWKVFALLALTTVFIGLVMAYLRPGQ